MQFHEGQAFDTTPAGVPPLSPARSDGRRLKIVIALLSALLFVAVVVAAFLGLQWRTTVNRYDTQQAAAEAVAAATAQAHAAADKLAVALTSNDPDSFDATDQAILDGTTGEFKEQYEKTSNDLRQVMRDTKTRSSGKVIDSAVQSATADEVVVLLLVNQTVSNATVPEPRVDRNRMKMTMTKVDGHWLASKVELR